MLIPTVLSWCSVMSNNPNRLISHYLLMDSSFFCFVTFASLYCNKMGRWWSGERERRVGEGKGKFAEEKRCC